MKTCPKCFNEVSDSTRFCPNCGEAVPAQQSDEHGLIGRTVADKYLVQELVGEGAMGSIYRAEQITLAKTVCIKVLHPHLTGDVTLSKRFHREARAASRLKHPNAINIIDFGTTKDGTHYIAMDFIDGRDLAHLLKKDFPLAPSRIIHLTEQVCSALDEAHAHGIVHRDLKPENIMVEDRRHHKDFVTVLDFGIAKIRDPGGDNPETFHTMAGIVCGTPEYMSPEQARGDVLDARSDIYSLGVILYQLSTGKLPFTGDTPIGVVTKHLTQEPIPPSEITPDVHPAMEEMILLLMSKDKEKRPPSCMEVRTMLQNMGKRIERDEETEAGTTTAPMARPTPEQLAGVEDAPRRGTPVAGTSPYQDKASSEQEIDDDTMLVPHGRSKGAIIAVVVVVLALLGGGGYFAYDHFFGAGSQASEDAEQVASAKALPAGEKSVAGSESGGENPGDKQAGNKKAPDVKLEKAGGTQAEAEAARLADEQRKLVLRIAQTTSSLHELKSEYYGHCMALQMRRDAWKQRGNEEKTDTVQNAVARCESERKQIDQVLALANEGKVVEAQKGIDSHRLSLGKLKEETSALLAEQLPALGEEARRKKVAELTEKFEAEKTRLTEAAKGLEKKQAEWGEVGRKDRQEEAAQLVTGLQPLSAQLDVLVGQLEKEDPDRLAMDYGMFLGKMDLLQPRIDAALKEDVAAYKAELERKTAEEEKRRLEEDKHKKELEEKRKKELAERRKKEEEERKKQERSDAARKKREEAERKKKEEEERKRRELEAKSGELSKEAKRQEAKRFAGLGDQANGQGQYAQAIMYYKKALKNSGSADLYKKLGKAYNAKGDHTNGAIYLKKYLKIMGGKLSPIQVELIKRQIRE